MGKTKKHRNEQKHRNNNKSKKRGRTFKKRDFQSGDGMLTSVWGPSMWHYLHIMSFNYPVKPTIEDKINSCTKLADFKKLFDVPMKDGKIIGNAPIYDFPKEI